MTSINDIQLMLQNILQKPVPQSEIAKALGTGRANISLRIKNRSEIQINEIIKLEKYFNISLIKTSSSPESALLQPNYENPSYIKLMQIINSADEKELDFYCGILTQCRKSAAVFKLNTAG